MVLKREKKISLVNMRLDGYSIHYIADKLGCSYQAVANYLNKIRPEECFVDPEHVSYPELDQKTKDSLVAAIVMCENDVSAICRYTEMEEQKVLKVIAYILARKPSARKKSRYPAVTTWMRHHMVSLRKMSEGTGVSVTTLNSVLDGKSYMSLKTARAIKAYSGLSLEEIFQEQMPDIDGEISKMRSVAQAEKKREMEMKSAEPQASRHSINPAKPRTKINLPPKKKTKGE